jgi:chemotaxis protein MotB
MGKPRKKAEEGKSGGDASVILFTALGLILLAFFIMLNNLATPDSSRTRLALNSLIGTFGLMPGYEAPGVGEDSATARSQNPSMRQVMRIVTGIIESFHGPGMDVKQLEDGRVVVTFDSDLLFAPGGWRLSPRFFEPLDALAELLERTGCDVDISGHTDARPSGRGRTNWYLSGARAASVHRYLEHAANIEPGTIHSAGYAETRPLPNATPEAQRRVEVVLLPEGSRL